MCWSSRPALSNKPSCFPLCSEWKFILCKWLKKKKHKRNLLLNLLPLWIKTEADSPSTSHFVFSSNEATVYSHKQQNRLFRFNPLAMINQTPKHVGSMTYSQLLPHQSRLYITELKQRRKRLLPSQILTHSHVHVARVLLAIHYDVFPALGLTKRLSTSCWAMRSKGFLYSCSVTQARPSEKMR